MKIPTNFKEIIKDTFYDKKLSFYHLETIFDDEGSVIEDGTVFVEELLCNAQVKNVEKIREEYGEDIEAECVVTCDITKAEMKDITEYEGVEYEVVKIIPSDTHTTLLLHHIRQGVENE